MGIWTDFRGIDPLRDLALQQAYGYGSRRPPVKAILQPAAGHLIISSESLLCHRYET